MERNIVWVSTTAFRTTAGTFVQATLLLLILTLIIPSLSHATIFFDSDWEGGSTAADGWDPITGGVLEISTDQELTGTHSLKGTYLDVNGSSTSFTNHAISPTLTHFFTRFGYRTAPGFQYGSNGYTKIMRFKSDAGWPIFWIETHYGVYSITVEAPYGGTDNYVWDSGVVPSTSSWDQVELEVQLNTPGQANGVVNLWINGVQRIAKTGLQLMGPTPTSVGPMGYLNPSTLTYNDTQIYVQSGLGMVYWDRVAVGDARIGLTSGLPLSTSAPPTPSGLRVQ